MPSDTPRDRQRRAMFAKMNQPSRSATKPSIIGRIRGAEQRLAQRFREARERKGKERIKREMEALKKERITAERLRAELEVEQAREAVAQQRIETQAKFSKIEKARFARTARGRAVAGIKAGARIGIAKIRAEARKKPRKKARRETGFFGIE